MSRKRVLLATYDTWEDRHPGSWLAYSLGLGVISALLVVAVKYVFAVGESAVEVLAIPLLISLLDFVLGGDFRKRFPSVFAYLGALAGGLQPWL